MKNLIVSSLETLTGFVFFVITIATAVGGYLAGKIIEAAGGFTPGAGSIIGVIIGLGMGLILAVLFTGLIYVQLSINERLREIKELLQLR